ncbi:MAG: histidine kinase dimerization/phosphoacceptor domain -containing protein [Planctomycetota bacterium]
MSLRLRLVLAILAVVAVMGVVSSITLRIHRGIQGRVAELDRAAEVRPGATSLAGKVVSVEGGWDEEGVFAAREIELLPQSRWPKLRGEIAAIDRAGRAFSLFGRRLLVTPETEFPETFAAPDPLGELAPGMRIEVTCRVDAAETWLARKIEVRALKASDKIKGTITRMGEGPGRELEIHGLRIALEPGVEIQSPQGPLTRMETATRMAAAAQECLAAAQELLAHEYRERGSPAGERPPPPAGSVDLGEEIEERLEDGADGFAYHLGLSRSQAEEEIRTAAAHGGEARVREERERIRRWLDPLAAHQAGLEEHIEGFRTRAKTDLDGAGELLRGSLAPFLHGEILPLVHAYHRDVEEELSEELQSIAESARAATRAAIATNAAGLVLALALGLAVARSISRPIRDLKAAAQEVGRGNLETRVAVRSRDEIGVLAAAFNRMTEALAASTVSVANLKSVIDSMAGALFLLDPAGRIASVNPAAAGLLGYEEKELAGRPFASICAETADEAAGTTMQPTERGIVSIVEKLLRRRDGTAIPVSFSGAVLRDAAGTHRGFVCVAQDLSDRRRMEERLRQSLHDRELLLREVHHRVKNNLQVISSLLDLQSRTVQDPSALTRFQECQDCIRSMVFIHDQLYRARDLDVIDLRVYLEQIVGNLAQAYLVAPDRIRSQVRVQDIKLDLDRALSCGLIVNELVTNAFRHAFAADASGEIAVACRPGDGGMLVLEVTDSGRGFEGGLDRPDASSLGLGLVSTLVRQLRGRIQFDGRQGAAYRIEFPAQPPKEPA